MYLRKEEEWIYNCTAGPCFGKANARAKQEFKKKKKELLHACYTAECSVAENNISSTNATKFDKGYQGRYFIDKQAIVRIKINLFNA
jgi:hypothetical protein